MASQCLPRPEPASLTPSRSYSTEEWEAKRGIITHLYRDESKKLYDIRMILATEYGFRPTEAMLKKRIKKWSLDRKHKEPEMLIALRLTLQREAQGKETVFVIRERHVTFQEVKRYFQRKGIKDLGSLAYDAETATSMVAVECHTPKPATAKSDVAALDADAPGDSQHQFWRNRSALYDAHNEISLASPNSTSQVPPVMRSTLSLRQLEQLLYLGRTYYDGTFENPAWRSMGNTFDLNHLERFYHAMFEGQRLLKSGSDHVEAFRHFGRAFDHISPLLRGQVLLFLPYLYHMIHQFTEVLGQGVLCRLLTFISEMVQEFRPQQVAILSSLEILQHMSAVERVGYSRHILQSILDRLQVEFLADVPDEVELHLDICSLAHQSGADSTAQGYANPYKLTTIAAWKLIYETETFWPRSKLGPEHQRAAISNSHYMIDLSACHGRWQVPETACSL